MPVSFLALTDIDEIRSSIGVDSTDLTDAMITDRRPQDDLESDLLTWVPSYQTLISEGLTGSPTADQKLKYLKLRLYSKYFLSARIASSGMLSILQSQSDGANQGSRYANVKISELVGYLSNEAMAIKEELLELIDTTSTAQYSQFGIAKPDFDPVTNA